MTTYLFTAQVEIEADSLDEAHATFDALREGALPSETYGVTLWDLKPAEPKLLVQIAHHHGEPSCPAPCDLRECFPGPENTEEFWHAATELRRTGRYVGGGGAASAYELTLVEGGAQ